MIQLVTPTPDIPCKPGWCLQYVRQTFGAPVVEPTATAGWANAKFRHEDWNFPEGVAVPVWFKLATEPAGHVALRMADGSVYSTSDDSTVPHHHPDMQDLIRYYWRNPLTYLGWSEDISGVRVVRDSTITFQSESITPAQEDDMPYTEDQIKQLVTEGVQDYFRLKGEFQDGRNAIDHLNQIRTDVTASTEAGRAAETAAQGVPAAVLYNERVDGRNVFDWLKQVRADVVGIQPGTVDVQGIAGALAEQLPKADAEALVDALASRLGGK